MATSTPAIETAGLQKSYGGVLAVSALDLKVEPGEIFGLVGADGAGKTTTIQMLCTLVPPSAGKARVLGMDTVDGASGIRRRIGYMSERFSLYPTLTVDENLDFFARLRNIPRSESERRKGELLTFCRLEPFRSRRAEHLSGGMQKKLSLACSLIHEPEVIFLDEPTTGVDPVSRRDFWKIITGFLARGITVLVSTPYLDEAERFNRVAFMHQGRIVACDTPRNLKAGMAGDILEIVATPVARASSALGHAPFLCSPHLFGNAIHIVVDDAGKRSSEVRGLLERGGVTVESIRPAPPSLEDAFVTRLARPDDSTSRLSPPETLARRPAISDRDRMAIVVSDLGRKFGSFLAVDRVSFEVERGEIFGLLGPNGSGKTTIIRMITGLLAPTSGSARVLGQDMARESSAARSRMGYMSQKFSLFADLTVEENINLYGGLYGLPKLQLEERRRWVLEMAGLTGKEKLMPSELSGGWRQRLALGCTIIHGPEVIFLDEPTAGVDPVSRRAFWGLIQELAFQGTTMFITTHYMDEAEHCHRLGLMYGGKLVALGSPSAMKTEHMKGHLLEVVSPDHARALQVLSVDARYRQASLFGSAIHVTVPDAGKASPEISRLLEGAGVPVSSIGRIPFAMEDVFLSMVEEHEGMKAS